MTITRKINLQKIILISTFIMASLLLNAQSFKAGIQLGIVGSQVDNDTYGGYRKMGIVGGLFVNRVVAPNLSIQMEMNYIQKGSQHNPNPLVVNDSNFYKISLHYLEVPILAKYKVKNYSFELGLAPSYLITSSEGDKINIFPNDFKKFELAILAGFYYHINEQFSVRLRGMYTSPWTPIRWIGNSTYFTSPVLVRQWNNLIEITLVYEFKSTQP